MEIPGHEHSGDTKLVESSGNVPGIMKNTSISWTLDSCISRISAGYTSKGE